MHAFETLQSRLRKALAHCRPSRPPRKESPGRSFPWFRFLLVGAVVTLLLASDAAAKGKGGKKGGGSSKDLPVCITIDSMGDLTGDSTAPYCASGRGITSFVGRRRSITLELKSNQSRRLLLTLGNRIADDLAGGDPDPNADGGVVNDPLNDWAGYSVPTLPFGGILGKLDVAYRVNVLNMGELGEEPNPNWRNGRLEFEDANGQAWTLLWGPHLQPGAVQRTNPGAPGVRITRRLVGGALVNAWDVTTTVDINANRVGAATAFLWRDNSPHGPQDYWGAFDVSFEFCAEEEP